MTEVREYKVIVLEEATREDMIKSQYRLDEMGSDEWGVHDECNAIDEKLKELDDYKRRKSSIKNGYKNRKR